MISSGGPVGPSASASMIAEDRSHGLVILLWQR